MTRSPAAAWKPANILRRLDRARDFPTNTCPASRHTVLIAEAILRGQPIAIAEREHIAGSLLVTVEQLWKLRTKFARTDVAPPQEAP